MTQVTPPGWYPDPGQTNDGAPTERWWDGTAWTDRTRPAQPAAAWGPPVQPQGTGPYAAQHGYPAYPGYPGYPAVPPPGGRRGVRTGIAVTVAVAVLASIGFGVYALTRGDSGDGNRADSRRGADGPGGPEGRGDGPGGESPSPESSRPPAIPGGGTVHDPLNGISLPVPKGWTGQETGQGAWLTSGDTYKCPGDTAKSCTAGGAYSMPVLNGSTAEEIAKGDIAKNAEESYGGATYGSITSHKVLASQAVTVAGQKGYLIRWKAVTSQGADGVVESLAFPSPANPRRFVVVRFGIDAGKQETVIEEITNGIKVSSGGGDGQSV
ncbi:DUF2510 domain-containing protein [Streptomyces sp. NPDC086787]|uniref:DUF2510 domain-containing protein n=1 Tax=Streptomyces sp. NPDC086787 TaxID=3365759 RepID=UPI003818C0DF